MTYITDAQVDRACATLRKAINAAENSNHAGEMFVIAAVEAPAMAEALREIAHSMKQAKVLGNDWKREIELTSNIVASLLARIGEA